MGGSMPRVTVEINGDDWQVYTTRLQGFYGLCCYDTKTIQIHSGNRGKVLLDTTIHEIMHAQFPKMKEREVSMRSTQFADVLWAMGWRRHIDRKK